MRKLFLLPMMLLLVCSAVVGQQAQPQPLTFYYDYTVNPGKEDEFMNLIKTVGAPVRDKLMADGVILAWGMETPILRYPGGTTHLIWFSVADWTGVEKVLDGMEARLASWRQTKSRSRGLRPQSERERRLICRRHVTGSRVIFWPTMDHNHPRLHCLSRGTTS